jgi:RNA polymerase sigma factor (sigma-70 family)
MRHLLVRMNEDRQLLAEFCAGGSERAFREIVERNLPLVYGTAMRLLNGDSHLAEDVAQAVFSNLARKARSLPREIVLAGWLHRDTRFTALEVLRKERRRKVRELEAAAMHEAESEAHPIVWSSIQPILDALLDELDDEDRHALLLRFLERRPLLAVGKALGITEDTARKRVRRALEKLRRSLIARGITTTGGALGAVLTSRGAEAVPAGLSARLVMSALATAGTTASVVSLYTLMASTKVITLTTVAAVLLLASVSTVKFNRTTRGHDGASETTRPRTESGNRPSLLSRMFVRTKGQEEAQPQSPDDATIGLALERLQKALHDPKPTRKIPDESIANALASMGDKRAAALPLLLEALRNGSDVVRNRAADALGQIGPEAREAVPILMQQLREGTAPGLIVWTLERVGPSPDLVPELVARVKGEAASWLTLANSLSTSFWGDTRSVADAVRPLLEDPDSSKREFAAYTLAALLRESAGVDVRKAVLEGLGSPDTDFQGLSMTALHHLGSDPKDPTGRVTRERLGPSAVEAIPALIDIANHSVRKDLQQSALQLLDVIDPGLRPENPRMQALLQYREEAAAFEAKARAGQLSVPELVDGIKHHPDAIGGIAEVLAGLGPEAKAALPGLHAVLNSLGTGSGDSVADAAKRSRDIDRVVDAIRRIAPDQPTPVFKESEVSAVFEVLEEVWRGSDPSRSQILKTAVSAALTDLTQGSAARLTADQMRRLLDSIQAADRATYESVAAKLIGFSPGFALPVKP